MVRLLGPFNTGHCRRLVAGGSDGVACLGGASGQRALSGHVEALLALNSHSIQPSRHKEPDYMQ